MKYLFVLLLVFSIVQSAFCASVDTLVVVSESMEKSIKNVVILPEAYQEDTEKAFPSLYLLHGATGNYRDWVSKASHIKELADTYEMIIVCPDGGYTSWYFDSPIDPKMQYETYVSQELVQEIDAGYRTLQAPASRAITGLSMGGHGGLYLGFRHQDVFGAAGSMSGGVDIRPFPNNWDIKDRIGRQAEFPDRWAQSSVINLLHLLDKPAFRIIIDCGTGDFFYQVNQNLHAKMVERNIPHEYIERPGRHNWDYWRNAIGYQLYFFHQFFSSTP